MVVQPQLTIVPATYTSDVVIVGAGPAGACAALLLARAGRRVTLLDRAIFPRDKICGDLIGTVAIALLRRLEIDLDVVAFTDPLRGAFVYAPSGERLGATLSARAAERLGARVIPRTSFDAALVAAAQRAGATLRQTTVSAISRAGTGDIDGVVGTDGTCYRAALTIGADGWSSVVARTIVGRPRTAAEVGLAARVYLSGITPARAMRFYVGAPGDGYGWIFPLQHGGANAGLGFVRGEPGSGALHAAFARFLQQRPELHGANETSPRQAWPIPFGWRGTPVSAAGALLVGDAASLASPLSGSGIHTAIASGALAATIADDALQRDDVSARALRVYDSRLAPIARHLRFERWFHSVAGTARGSTRAIALANAIPGSGRVAVNWLLNLG